MKHCSQPKSPLGLSKAASTLSCLMLIGCFHAGIESTPPAAKPEQTASEPHSPASPASTEKSETSTENDPGQPRSIERTLVQKIAVPEPCGDHSCTRFDSAKDALFPLILERRARLIAFGEAHAPAGYSGVPTVQLFTESLLPKLASGSSHLLVELLQPPKEGCQRERKIAQEESTEVTQGQADSNQNEYLALGVTAHKLGVTPDILYASCEDMARIAAPEGGVVAMMEAIASLSAVTLAKYLKTTRKGRPLVLAYGGALHNDAVPRPSRASWSYGPKMLEATEGSYLEIDLIVPELIQDTESWRSFAWYDAYQALDHKEGAVLMKWGQHSYSLFFAPDSSAHDVGTKVSSPNSSNFTK
jgi:hypothetical protein